MAETALYRNRRSLLYQFPLNRIVRNTQTNLYERVFAYLERDPNEPHRRPPDPPERRRVKQAVEEAASRYASTYPSLDIAMDSFRLAAPMAAETVTDPPTFYCTSCGRVNHADSRARGFRSDRILAILRDQNGGDLRRCVDCRGHMTQLNLIAVHPAGLELPVVESPRVRCDLHGSGQLRFHNFQSDETRRWIITCDLPGCTHHKEGLRGGKPPNARVADLPDAFRFPYRVRPVGASTTLLGRMLSIPFGTEQFRPPPSGSGEAAQLVASATGAAGHVASWRDRPTQEQQQILDVVARGEAETPAEAESKLIKFKVLRPHAQGPVDPRASDPAALEQAQIVRKIHVEGDVLDAPPPLRRVTSHRNMPLSTILYGYTYNAMDPRECVLMFYTERREREASRPVLYYHTGATEALMLEFQFDAASSNSPDALHTWTHAIMRALGESSGHGESSLAEYLLPAFNAALIYPTESTELVLGLLRRAWTDDADTIVARAEEILQLCPGDPFCSREHGACGQCVMLPAHTCQTFNDGLDRRAARAAAAPPPTPA